MYIGKTPTSVPLTTSDVTDGIITNAKLAQDNNQNIIELPFGKLNLNNPLSSKNDFLNTEISFGIRLY